MRWLEYVDELGGLLVVGVRGEGDVVNGHLKRQLLTGHCRDFLRLGQDRLSERAFHAVTCTNPYKFR